MKVLPVCAAALALLAVAGCGSGGNRAPEPTPVLSPAPSAVPIDLDLADRLYEQGDYEQALTIYSAAAQRGTAEEKQRGLWALARIHLSRGEHNAAEQTVKAYREIGGQAALEGPALLLLGKSQFAQGDFDGARKTFDEYVDLGGPAWPYATLYLGRIASQKGDKDSAVRLFDEALAAGLPAAVETESLLDMARFQQEAGDEPGARGTYQRAVDAAPSSLAAADALAQLAAAAAEAGDASLAAESMRALIVDYPASVQALEALSDPAAGASVTTRERALVLFRNRENGPAAEAFQAIVDSGEGVGEARYYLGILAERSEQWDEAVAQYDAAIASGESAWFAAQATWDRATVLERLGRTDEAIAGFAGVAAIMPGHEQAGPGVFRAGLLSYQLGRPGDALGYWQTFLDVAPNAAEETRANFWLGKASDALGDRESAGAYFEAAMNGEHFDYYALRARVERRVADHRPPEIPETGSPSPTPNDEPYLATIWGPENPVTRDALFAAEPWRRAVELAEAGYDDQADDEFQALLDANEGNPWLLYRLAQEIDELGRPWISAPAARTLVGSKEFRSLLRLAYPKEYFEIVSAEAEANGFSPYLLLALVRQESLYDPSAVSPAEAMGLTQVIPSTADGIAEQLAVEDFHYSDLFRPNVALRFGAYYFGSQLEGFGGVAAAALAAYNGGPGNAGRWWEAAGGDPDLFLETIEYPETRAYVELVLENYAIYRFAYGETFTAFLE